MLFRDRAEAGRAVAAHLGAYAHRPDVIVLALPRGGVPVGYEIARELEVPLDVFVVRKLGVPGHEELAMGAIATGGVRVKNEDVARVLGITAETFDHAAEREAQELERREELYRGNRPPPNLESRTVILVNDGLATGIHHARGRGRGEAAKSGPHRDRRPGGRRVRVRRTAPAVRRSGVPQHPGVLQLGRPVVLGLFTDLGRGGP